MFFCIRRCRISGYQRIVCIKHPNGNQVEYDLQNLNDALPFENLQAGTYQYRVTASNATNQNYIVINQSFVVSSDPTVQVGATEDAITIENGSKIPNITVGTSVSISGIVRSASSNITTITVGVYDSNHKMVTGKKMLTQLHPCSMSRNWMTLWISANCR